MKFLCDVMLSRLGRWLRAAGYDTLIAEADQADRDLLQQAIAEQRLLISLDRKLSEHRNADKHIIILNSNKIDESVHELTERLHLNWLFKPFSRCLLCNALLVRITPDSHAGLPDDVLADGKEVRFCADCNQVYWRGSHVSRMRKKLAAWNNLLSPTAPDTGEHGAGDVVPQAE